MAALVALTLILQAVTGRTLHQFQAVLKVPPVKLPTQPQLFSSAAQP